MKTPNRFFTSVVLVVALGVLAYGVLLACLLTFWLTTTAIFGGPLP